MLLFFINLSMLEQLSVGPKPRSHSRIFCCLAGADSWLPGSRMCCSPAGSRHLVSGHWFRMHCISAGAESWFPVPGCLLRCSSMGAVSDFSAAGRVQPLGSWLLVPGPLQLGGYRLLVPGSGSWFLVVPGPLQLGGCKSAGWLDRSGRPASAWRLSRPNLLLYLIDLMLGRRLSPLKRRNVSHPTRADTGTDGLTLMTPGSVRDTGLFGSPSAATGRSIPSLLPSSPPLRPPTPVIRGHLHPSF